MGKPGCKTKVKLLQRKKKPIKFVYSYSSYVEENEPQNTGFLALYLGDR